MGKIMLAHAPGRPLPKAVLSRPKTGFSVPMASWLSKWTDHQLIDGPAADYHGGYAMGAALGLDRRRLG